MAAFMRTLFWACCLGLILTAGASAQNRLLKYSDSVQDRRGNAMSYADIYVYQTGTTTLVSLYSDTEGTTATDNPTQTDFYGRMEFYVPSGFYDMVVQRSGAVEYTLTDIPVGFGVSIEDSLSSAHFGCYGDGVNDMTLCMQDALDYAGGLDGAVFTVKPGDFIINPATGYADHGKPCALYLGEAEDDGSSPHDNLTIVFEPNVSFRHNDSAANTEYPLILIENVHNLTILGSATACSMRSDVWDADMYEVIEIRGGENIKISGLTVSGASRDGLWLAPGYDGSDTTTASKITIEECIFRTNQNNGLTVTSGRDVLIRDSLAYGNYDDADCDAGFYFGGERSEANIDNLSISGCSAFQNCYGFRVQPLNYDTGQNITNVSMVDCSTRGNYIGFSVEDFFFDATDGTLRQGSVAMTACLSSGDAMTGFFVYNSNRPVNFTNCRVVNSNTQTNPGDPWYDRGFSYYVTSGGLDLGDTVGNVQFSGCAAINSASTNMQYGAGFEIIFGANANEDVTIIGKNNLGDIHVQGAATANYAERWRKLEAVVDAEYFRSWETATAPEDSTVLPWYLGELIGVADNDSTWMSTGPNAVNWKLLEN